MDLEDALKEAQDVRELLESDRAHDQKCAETKLRNKQEELDETRLEIKTLQVRCGALEDFDETRRLKHCTAGIIKYS